MVEKIENLSIRIYVNKSEKRITFKIKIEYYIELLTPETMKLLGSTENKISKDKNLPHVQITKVVLVCCNIVTIISKFQEVCIHLLQINHLVVY